MGMRDGEEWVQLVNSPFKCEGCDGKCDKRAQWAEYVIRCDKSCCASTNYCNKCAAKEGCFSAEVEIDNEDLEEFIILGDIMTPIQQREALRLLKEVRVIVDFFVHSGDLGRQIKTIVEEIEISR